MWQKQETLELIEKKNPNVYFTFSMHFSTQTWSLKPRVISHLFRRCRKWAQVSHNERATVKTRKKNSEREEET